MHHGICLVILLKKPSTMLSYLPHSGVKANSNLPGTVARHRLASREMWTLGSSGTSPTLSPLRYLTSRIFEEGDVAAAAVRLARQRDRLVRSQVDAREQTAPKETPNPYGAMGKRCTQTVTLYCGTAYITRYTKWQCEEPGPIPSD